MRAALDLHDRHTRFARATTPTTTTRPTGSSSSTSSFEASTRRHHDSLDSDHPHNVEMSRAPRDVERIYAVDEVVAKLRRLADALEAGEPFRIQIAGQRIRVPVRAEFSVAHERDEDSEEIEFQFTWSHDEQPNGSGVDEPVV
jgi:amphi-Trp domain-containing protein